MGNIADTYNDLVDSVITDGIFRGSLICLNKESLILHEYPNVMRFTHDYLEDAKRLSLGYFEQHPSFPKITREERSRIYETEKHERDMILNDLKFAAHIMMCKYNEPTTSRRFVATNDSCLSFVQVTITDTHFRWVFVSRSTEINRMLPADLMTIGTIIREWTDWFWNDLHKYDKTVQNQSSVDFFGKKVSLVLLMNNPHYYR